MRRLLVIAVCLAAGAAACPSGAARGDAAERPAWTTSRVVGTPDPPLPWVTRPVWPGVRFERPTLVTALPGAERMVVGEQSGRVWSFRTTPEVHEKDLAIDLRESVALPEGRSIEALYGLAFDPAFPTNRLVYLCYVIRGKAGEVLEDGSRVSRFRVTDADPPTIDPASEMVLLTFRGGGHNGGCLEFGPDGCLYVSTGDGAGPNPPDQLRTGQDCGDLLSSILRIDVADATAGRPYRVPDDNPFVGLPGVRPEIWAYGLRNPWKMTFDRETGDLWVADVGWDQWELVHRVTRGANLGWAAFEGVQPILPGLDHGPSPPQPPLVALPHTIAASVTGGYVYRGSRLPELRGVYVFGDWETKRVWGVRCDERGNAVLEDLADSGLQIVAFGEDHAGELVLADYGQGVLHGIERADAAGERPPFPVLLSQTGLFADTARQIPAAGVLPFEVNQPQWSDFATARRWIALPGTGPVVRHPADRAIPGSMFRRQHDVPAGAVLAKTLSLETIHGDPGSVRPIETQLLHFDGETWRAYAYAWNDDHTDAALVPAEGAERTIEVRDDAWAGGRRQQRWAFAGRAQCLSCHTPWAQHALAFTPAQLHRDVPHPGDGSAAPVNQLAWLEEHGWYRRVDATGAPLPPADEAALAGIPRLARRGDPDATPAALARGYLHVQCSHCHRFNGGGAGSFELLLHLTDAATGLLDEPARQGTLDIPEARLVVPGAPERSLLYVRMATFGRGRMPHLASEFVDEEALGWVGDWIRGLGPEPDGPRPDAAGRAALNPVAAALAAARAIGRHELPPSDRDRLLAEAAVHPSSLVRDLFSGYQPPERRRRTLGTHIVPEQILALTGSARRGADLFAGAAGLQCRTCHRLDGAPGAGPDLRAVVGTRTRGHLLESLVEPSRSIDPAWRTHVVETTAGRVVTGLVMGDDGRGMTLRDATGRDTFIPRDQVETVSASGTSLMPAGLLRDLTAGEAADLLAFLESLGGPPTPAGE